MTEKTRTYPLVEALMWYFRLSWYWVAIIVTAGLILLLVLVQYLDGTSINLLDWRFWQRYLSGPILTGYILVVHMYMWRLRKRAIQVFKPLLPLNEGDFNRLATEVATPKRHWEWTSLLLGLGFACAIGQPWNLGWGPGEFWLSVYLIITSGLMNALLVWLIYDTLDGAIRLNRLSRRDLKLDIFYTDQMMPLARWSLGISLAFIGGISLSLVFRSTWENLLEWTNITTYSILILATILIFFVSMWSAHNAMTRAKKYELSIARKHLAEFSRELKDLTAKGQLDGTEGLSSAITSWATYQRLVKEAPVWPFNANIIRRLLASTIVPATVYLIKIISGLGLRF